MRLKFLVTPEVSGALASRSISNSSSSSPLLLIFLKKRFGEPALTTGNTYPLKIYENFEDFLEKEKPAKEHLFFFSKTAQKNLFEAQFKKDSYLIFGSETKGLDPTILAKYSNELVSLPMYSEHIRSLNLSNAATAAAYEALRQIDFNNIS